MRRLCMRQRHLVGTDRQGNVIVNTLDDHHIGAHFREAEYHADQAGCLRILSLAAQ